MIKRIQVLALLMCVGSLQVMGCETPESKTSCYGKVVEYPGIGNGYTPVESLVESIESGVNNIPLYVTIFGKNILRKIDPITGKSMAKLAGEADNYESIGSLHVYLGVNGPWLRSTEK